MADRGTSSNHKSAALRRQRHPRARVAGAEATRRLSAKDPFSARGGFSIGDEHTARSDRFDDDTQYRLFAVSLLAACGAHNRRRAALGRERSTLTDVLGMAATAAQSRDGNANAGPRPGLTVPTQTRPRRT